MWGLVLIVTLTKDLVQKCDPIIGQSFDFISDLENGVADMMLVSIAEGCTIDFFAAVDDASPVLHLEGVDLGGFRLTRQGKVVEFWFQGEHENSAGLHFFMKEYAFTRCWAAFQPRQLTLGMKPVAQGALPKK